MKLKKTLLCAVMTAGLILSGCSSGEYTMEELTSGVTVSETSSKGNVEELTVAPGDLLAVIEVKGYGTIMAKLFPEAAPVGVDNFKQLADSGYFTGLKIHRVVSDFMFQGGSLNGDGTGGDAMVNDGSFGVETAENCRHFYGALCYANAAGQNSTQFYIVNNKTPQDLDKFDTSPYIARAEQFEAAAADSSLPAEYAEYYNFQANYYRTTAQWAESAGDDVKRKYLEAGGTPSLDGNYTVFGQVYSGFDVIDEISSAEVADNGSNEVSKPVQDIIIKSVKVYEYTNE